MSDPYGPLSARLLEMRKALVQKMATKPDDLTYDAVRDLAALHLSIAAVKEVSDAEGHQAIFGPMLDQMSGPKKPKT